VLEYDDIMRWETDQQEFCAQIDRMPAVFKVLLKTKNDPFFLERWIVHHLGIVGPGNLVIFDNMSDHPEVLAIYRRYAADINIVRFSGFHNDVHNTRVFPALYGCLSKTSEFFCFLDTDELLVLFDDRRYYANDSVPEFIKRHHDAGVFPGAWLYNTDGSDTRFVCGSRLDYLANCMAWGKPILRSNAISRATSIITYRSNHHTFLLHSCQVSGAGHRSPALSQNRT
jgi:hypothetical protein